MNLQRDRWTNSSVQKKTELSKKSGFLGGTTDVGSFFAHLLYRMHRR